MQTTHILGAVAVFLWASAAPGLPGQAPPAKKARPHAGAPATHIMTASEDVKFGPGPDFLPSGAQVAVLQGDPMKAGVPFVFQVNYVNPQDDPRKKKTTTD